MAAISYSAFFQALGWAALNSFWQTGLLWCVFLMANYLFRLSSRRKYDISVICIAASFLLFCGNIVYYLLYGSQLDLSLISLETASTSGWLPVILTSASITYLILLVVPAYRLFENWRSLRLLQRYGLQKTGIEYRLFVHKMSELLGIKRKVAVYLSDIIHSPVTIGYLKPIILLPIASLNHLTLQQAEAVLLHELSHIRRYDYLVNIIISVVHTLLYFNPFVKLFVRMAEASREESCDQMVLQFGYDRISYASALLNLEKATAQNHVFAMGAAGKSHLLQRIEKIAGINSRSRVFSFTHVAGFIAALLFAVTLHTFFAARQDKGFGKLFVFNHFASPYYFIGEEETEQKEKPSEQTMKKAKTVKLIIQQEDQTSTATIERSFIDENADKPNFIHVSLNEVDANLSAEEKNQVKSTVKLAREVLRTYEWSKLKESIPDGLTESEEKTARLEYLAQINKINWGGLEENLKADYKNINWEQIDASLKKALRQEELDSLECSYMQALAEIEAAEQKNTVEVLPFPDESIQQIEVIKQELNRKLDTIQTIRKKVIKL